MSEEIELAAKAFGDTVGELTERAGLTGPTRELAGFLTSYIHPRREAFAAKQLVAAAEKIKRAGVPPRAVRDETLRALLEGGSLADDQDMQERWANLLANAFLKDATEVPSAYPRILGELEPVEAAMLDLLMNETPARSFDPACVSWGRCQDITGISYVGVENLTRLGLVHMVGEAPVPWLRTSESDEGEKPRASFKLTELGRSFVEACREPGDFRRRLEKDPRPA